jgi:sugar lactone lactonase YvrE
MRTKMNECKLIILGIMVMLVCTPSCKKDGTGDSPPPNKGPKYVVTSFAGNGTAGLVNGTGPSAEFNHPFGITVDSEGNLYVADEGNNCIRKIDSTGLVTTLAGSGAPGYADGSGQIAMFNSPDGVAVDSLGNIYVADVNNECIRKIAPDGTVSTLAGNPYQEGFQDGAGINARFAQPTGITLDSAWNIIVADAANECIRRIDQKGNVTTLAGSPNNAGFAEGTGSAAKFDNPQGCMANAQGDILVADVNNNRIRYVTRQGTVSTLAGNSQEGHADGTGAAAKFAGPTGIWIKSDSSFAYVADATGETIRLVSASGAVTTIAGDPLLQGYADGIGAAARFAAPTGIAVDRNNHIYVVDYINNRIRKIVKQP